MLLTMFASKRLQKSYVRIEMVCVGTCDKNNLPWFVVGYDFYPTRLYIPGNSHITMILIWYQWYESYTNFISVQSFKNHIML